MRGRERRRVKWREAGKEGMREGDLGLGNRLLEHPRQTIELWHGDHLAPILCPRQAHQPSIFAPNLFLNTVPKRYY